MNFLLFVEKSTRTSRGLNGCHCEKIDITASGKRPAVRLALATVAALLGPRRARGLPLLEGWHYAPNQQDILPIDNLLSEWQLGLQIAYKLCG